MRKYRYDLLILIPFFLRSCATILNRKTTNVHVYTNIPATILSPSATSNGEVTNCDFAVVRSKKPLTITAYNDTIRKTVTVKPIHSFAYWLNLGEPPYSFIGFIIDKANDKRFTYPVNIYLELTTNDSSYPE